jgi:hypothetical protein
MFAGSFAKLLSIAEHSDKPRSAGILPAREKCRLEGGATKTSVTTFCNLQ